MFTRSIFASLLLTVPAWAEDIRTSAPVTAATVYSQGASVTREVAVEVPAGQHRILFPMPQGAQGSVPRITAQGGLTLGAVERIRGLVTDAETLYSAEQQAAQRRVDAAERVVQQRMDAIAAARVDLAGALSTIDFLKSVKGGALTTIDAEALQNTALVIGTQIGAAEAQRQAVERQLRQLQTELTDAQKAEVQARADFERLFPPRGTVDMLAVSVDLAAPQEVEMLVEYITPAAGWTPHYTLRLNSEAGTITGERKAQVRQDTGEIWSDVALVLSTADPYASVEPSKPWPDQARIDRNDLRKVRSAAAAPPPAALGGSLAKQEADAVLMEEPVIETFGGPEFDGVAVTYAYPKPVTLTPQGFGQQLRLGDFTLEAETRAIATPELDDTAYLVTDIRNTLAEPILSGQAELYRDGGFLGTTGLELIPAGAEAEISFGALETIQLDYRVLDNDTGDAGVVSRSNTREQTMEFTVENLGATSETVTALFALPYSEQEDLQVTVRARPAPTTEDWEKKRGVGAWELALAPGAKITVRVDVGFRWPTDQQLYWQP